MTEAKEGRLAYSVAELSKTLGVSRDSIYAAIKSGDLAAIKMGRPTIIPHDAVEAFIRALPRLSTIAAAPSKAQKRSLG